MTSTILPALEKLREYKKINVIDVGAARASFLVELEKFFNLDDVYSLGIDPFDHGVSSYYDKFLFACVDNVDSPTEKYLLKNKVDDQANTLCTPLESVKNEFDDTIKVSVLNLNHVIKEQFGNKEIHFLKIDAEGKDLHIVKSLKDSTLKRIKYIAIECPIKKPRFDDEYLKNECIEYLSSKNFDVSFVWDSDNGSDLSDVVFVNKIEL